MLTSESLFLMANIISSRILKKADLHLKVVRDAFGHTQTIYDKLKAQVDAQPKDDGSLLEKRREHQREVDIAKRAYTQQVRSNYCSKTLISFWLPPIYIPR